METKRNPMDLCPKEQSIANSLEAGVPFIPPIIPSASMELNTLTRRRQHQISIGELFTSSLFCIPAMLLHNHGFIVNSVLIWMVFSTSLVYHRHNVETCSNPNKCMRTFDILSTLVACTALIIYGHNDLRVMIIAIGVPVFYALERFTKNRNGGDDALLCGPAGAHVLLHLSAIVSCCFLAYVEGSLAVKVEKDIETICFGFIMGCFFFVIFQPRKYGHSITNKEMIDAIFGISKETANKTFAATPVLKTGDSTTVSISTDKNSGDNYNKHTE
jgi:hypothetical protein